MQVDFHYYCIAVLARAAGFPTQDALTIAYASQYVDNATEGEPLTLTDGGVPILKFDPVRTAYIGLKATDWDIQKRVYLPFHFLPPLPFDYSHPLGYTLKPYDYITEPDSQFARMLLHRAARVTDERRRLCAIGIALHTFADTWAHQGFSGRLSEMENAVENVDIFDAGGWKRDLFTDDILDALTSLGQDIIGHAQAGFLPDLSFMRWKCEKRPVAQGHGKKPVPRSIDRDNTDEFFRAAKTIYTVLVEIVETLRQENPRQYRASSVPWKKISVPIVERFRDRGCLGESISFEEKVKMYLQPDFLSERCQHWIETFDYLFDPPTAFVPYDKTLWRRQALDPSIRDEDPARTAYRSSNVWMRQWGRTWEGEGWGGRSLRSGWEEQDREALFEKWGTWASNYKYEEDPGLERTTFEWDRQKKKEFAEKAVFPFKPDFPDSWWVHFHRAALVQQHFVAELIP